jgi:uroporphyrin-III C-methyltransferase
MRPKVYLVGAGPGAPDLLTLRAARLLVAADIVFFDALVHPDTLALAEGATKVPVGKRRGRPSPGQEVINRALVRAASRHRTVVRLKGGDPMIFGRAHEEIAALERAGVEWEVVPGVTAALAASAELGVSLTRRGLSRSVTFVTPAVGTEERRTDWASAVVAADTAAIYMGAGEAERIAAALLARGLSHATPVVMIVNASLPDQAAHWGTLASLPRLAARRGEAPAIILMGRVLDEAIQDIAQDREGAVALLRLIGPLVPA